MKNYLIAVMVILIVAAHPMASNAAMDNDLFDKIKERVSEDASVFATLQECGLKKLAGSLFSEISAAINVCNPDKRQLSELKNILENGKVVKEYCEFSLETFKKNSRTNIDRWKDDKRIIKILTSIYENKKACREYFQ
ncbi:MAG: hypothetical protein GKS00_13240 [Alphaproteobacteria bacterium]|nr:hypothetical protein [Alphaproteobacteria bacterium]